MNAPSPGWLPDPDARHEYRYWDGNRWTDDVADGGVASTDSFAGGGASPPPPATGADPTAQINPTEQFPSAPVPPAPQYLGGGSGGDQSPQYPGPTPPRKGWSPGLIAGLAVVAIALIGGITWLVVRDDGDDSADDATEISDSGDTSNDSGSDDTSDDTSDESSGDGSSGDDSSGDDSSGSSGNGSLPDELENDDAIAEMLASGIEQAFGGRLTHDEAVCVSEGFIDQFGLSEMVEMGTSGSDPFTDSDLEAQVRDILTGCDIDPDELGGFGT